MDTLPWVLVAEDDAELAETLERILSSNGYKVIRVTKAGDAVAKLQNQQFSVIVLDIRLEKNSSGEDVITAVRGDRKGLNFATPIVVTSGFLDADLIRRIGTHVSGVLVKPFNSEALLTKIAAALEKASAKPA